MTDDESAFARRELLHAVAIAYGYTGAQAETALQTLGDRVRADVLLDWLVENCESGED